MKLQSGRGKIFVLRILGSLHERRNSAGKTHSFVETKLERVKITAAAL